MLISQNILLQATRFFYREITPTGFRAWGAPISRLILTPPGKKHVATVESSSADLNFFQAEWLKVDFQILV